MTQTPEDLARQIINNRPQLPAQLLGHTPADRNQAINLLPPETKLQIAQLVIDRMTKAYNLNAHTTRDGNTLTITINP